jgi:hypothetical protein
MVKVRWDGAKVNKWTELTGKSATEFTLCVTCWDNIAFGDLDSEEKLQPQNGDPQDKYLAVMDEDCDGICYLCKLGD